MIIVLAPPGCYGSYIARCLTYYCNPDTSDYTMDFDVHGSSHAFWDERLKQKSENKVKNLHYNSGKINSPNRILILPDNDHLLDYYNNQYSKKNNNNLCEFLTTLFDYNYINNKLKTHWNYRNGFNNYTPLWIIREFCSFWMIDSWKHTYNKQHYLNIGYIYAISAEDLWQPNFYQLLKTVSGSVGETLYSSQAIVEKNHQAFLNKQKYHNSHKAVIKWVDDLLNGTDSENPCQTVFDEAYVQYLLREKGVEIKCNELNIFPKTANEFKDYLYEASTINN